jgi:hypothetical protein
MSSNSNSNREVKRQKAANSSNRPRIQGRKKPANLFEFKKQTKEQKVKKSVVPSPKNVTNYINNMVKSFFK